MKQEPVAWMARNQLNNKYVPISCEEKEKVLPHVLELYDNWIPLYTEPQYRELSDEDRLAFTKAYFNIHPEAHLSEQFKIKLYELNDFARAILKKASEK